MEEAVREQGKQGNFCRTTDCDLIFTCYVVEKVKEKHSKNICSLVLLISYIFETHNWAYACIKFCPLNHLIVLIVEEQ